jgi:hypothetical protein
MVQPKNAKLNTQKETKAQRQNKQNQTNKGILIKNPFRSFHLATLPKAPRPNERVHTSSDVVMVVISRTKMSAFVHPSIASLTLYYLNKCKQTFFVSAKQCVI